MASGRKSEAKAAAANQANAQADAARSGAIRNLSDTGGGE